MTPVTRERRRLKGDEALRGVLRKHAVNPSPFTPSTEATDTYTIYIHTRKKCERKLKQKMKEETAVREYSWILHLRYPVVQLAISERLVAFPFCFISSILLLLLLLRLVFFFIAWISSSTPAWLISRPTRTPLFVTLEGSSWRAHMICSWLGVISLGAKLCDEKEREREKKTEKRAALCMQSDRCVQNPHSRFLPRISMKRAKTKVISQSFFYSKKL